MTHAKPPPDKEPMESDDPGVEVDPESTEGTMVEPDAPPVQDVSFSLNEAVIIDPLKFFRKLQRMGFKSGYMEIRCPLPGGGARQDFVSMDASDWPEEAAKITHERQGSGLPVYFSPNPRFRKGGGKADVQVIKFLFADIDLGDGDVPKQPGVIRIPTKEEAIKWLSDLVHEGKLPSPTGMVDSGHGIHVYWFLDQPLLPGSFTDAERVAKHIAVLLKGDGNLVPVCSVMRTPGTINLKDRASPKQVKIIHWGAARHTLECFGEPTEAQHFGGKGPARRKGPRQRVIEANHDMEAVPPMHRHLQSVLKRAGIVNRPKHDSDGRYVGTELKHCPYCGHLPSGAGGQSTYSCWVTSKTLTLKCWRSHCPAHAEGKPPETWLGDLRLKHNIKEQELLPFAPVPIEQSEMLIAELWDMGRQYWNESTPVLAISPGTGKTRHALIRLLWDACMGRGGTLLLPTWDAVEEKVQELQQLLGDGEYSIEIIQGKTISRHCLRRDELKAAGRYTRSWRRTVCAGCVHLNSCPVVNQYRDIIRPRTIVVSVHHALPSLQRDKMLGNYVILDEYSRHNERTHRWTRSDLEAVIGRDAPWAESRRMLAQILARVLDDVSAEAENATGGTPPALFGKYVHGEALQEHIRRASEALGIPLCVAEDALHSCRQPFPVNNVAAADGSLEDLVPADIDLLFKSNPNAAVRIPAKGGAAEFVLFRVEPMQVPVPMIVLDATGPHSMMSLKQALPERPPSVIEGQVTATNASFICYETTTYQPHRLRLEGGRVKKALLRDARTFYALAKELALVRGNSTPRIGVITLKGLETHARQVFTTLGADVVADHFGNIRGTNKFEDVDALVVLGDMSPNLEQAGYEAHVLGVSSDQRRWDIRRAESIQALGRARAIRRTSENPVVIIHATTHWCLRETPDVLTPPRGRAEEEIYTAVRCFLQYLLSRFRALSATMLTPQIGGGAYGLLSQWVLYSFNYQLCKQPVDPLQVLERIKGSSHFRRIMKKVAEDAEAEKRSTHTAKGKRTVVWELAPGAYDIVQERNRRDAELQETAPFLPLMWVTLEENLASLTKAGSKSGGKAKKKAVAMLRNLLRVAREGIEHYGKLFPGWTLNSKGPPDAVIRAQDLVDQYALFAEAAEYYIEFLESPETT